MRSFLSAQKERDGCGLNSMCCGEYSLDSNPILAAIGYSKGVSVPEFSRRKLLPFLQKPNVSWEKRLKMCRAFGC
jgi:hypothetical protein